MTVPRRRCHRRAPIRPGCHPRALASGLSHEDDGRRQAMTGTTTLTRERADLIESLRRHRGFLRFTVRGLTEEQARLRPTVSALYLGGLIKHVAATEAQWVRFAEGGAEAMNRNWGPDAYMRHWHLQQGETLGGVLADYNAV